MRRDIKPAIGLPEDFLRLKENDKTKERGERYNTPAGVNNAKDAYHQGEGAEH